MRKTELDLRRARPLLLLLAVAALAGCATAPRKGPDVVWPLPPEKPRVKWVRSFASEDDLGSGTMKAIARAFVPGESGLNVAQPTGLALSPDERTLYVACSSARRLLAVDLEKGKFRQIATADGKRPDAPFGVATDTEGNLYVTDHVAGVVWVYGPDGTFLRKFGAGKLDRASGIAIDRRRQVVYVTAGAGAESKHHRVEVFSQKGQHLRTIGTRGSEAGQFNFPANLAVSKDGQLVVVDMLNFRVQVFDPDGQLAAMFGAQGDGQPGTFDKAKSVAFDSFGNLYVVDSQQAFVQLFNPRFQPLMAFGGRGGDPGYLSLPTAIAITSQNTIFVADFAAGSVNEYRLVNTTAADSFGPSDAPAKQPDGATVPAGASPTAPPPTGQKPQGG